MEVSQKFLGGVVEIPPMCHGGVSDDRCVMEVSQKFLGGVTEILPRTRRGDAEVPPR